MSEWQGGANRWVFPRVKNVRVALCGQNCRVFPRVESIRWSELKVFPESGKYQSGRGNDLYSTAVLSQAINSRVDPWDPSAGHNYTQ